MVNARLVSAMKAVHRRFPERGRRRLHPILDRLGLATDQADNDHPERLAVLAHVALTPVLEVGCGPRKTRADFVGLDLTPGGDEGSVGNAAGRPSEADVAADGRFLPFANGTFPTLVARHNLEHYVDLIAVLREWQRVIVPGGIAIIVVPDEDGYPGRTLELDPTHYHAFNIAFVRQLFALLGWEVRTAEVCIPAWSLLVVARTPSA
jgi:SAM-dependent methyltransferase